MSNGADVKIGDLITFAPGNKPMRVVKIAEQVFTHPTLGLDYRLMRTADDVELVLFDTQIVQFIERDWAHKAARGAAS